MPPHALPLRRQPRTVRSLHWLSLLLLLAVFGLVLAHQALDDKAWQQLSLNLHRSLGLLVWALAAWRLVVRSRVPMRPSPAGTPRWQRLAASATHGLMYLLLLVLPLLGWALSNARGLPLAWPLPGSGPSALAWPGRDLDLADTLETLHGSAAWLLAGTVGLHAAVALWHHLVQHDDVLRAMLPDSLAPGAAPGAAQSPARRQPAAGARAGASSTYR